MVVDWDGAGVSLPLRVPAETDGDWEVEVVFESGRRERRAGRLFDLPADGHVWPAGLGGRVHCLRHAPLPGGELGYHDVTWRAPGGEGRARLIAAPTRAWGGPGEGRRRWGVFAPLYAARTPRSGGAGDLESLGWLRSLVEERGGDYVATLPLLAAFLDEPCQPSPYAPASRLYWNELYLDLHGAAAATLGGMPPAARARWDEHAAERLALAAAPEVDYRRQYAWRRGVLDELAAAAWADPGTGAELRRFATGRVLDYAVFRAIGETRRASWRTWPAALADGVPVARSIDQLPDLPEVDPARVRSHVFAQWAMDRQLAEHELVHTAGLYLNLPVGVGCDAYEVWRDRDLFVLGAAAGAPPDALFLGGQDWGLPPVHPARSRATGHRYVVDCVRHHMRHASMLRVDHVMGLWRLYWVPEGMSARAGVYVRQPADELVAILTLESHRHGCAVVGEDLGTVPDYVRPAMGHHGMFRLHVGEFAMPAAPGDAPEAAPAGSVASMNTHDTATFAGWWRGADLDDQVALGLTPAAEAEDLHAGRARSRAALLDHVDRHDLAPADLPDPARAFAGATADLAAGPAEVVLVTLEDLWLEDRPQNVPGTSTERPNWRRPFARSLADLGVDPSILGYDGEPGPDAGPDHEPAPVDLGPLDDIVRRRPPGAGSK